MRKIQSLAEAALLFIRRRSEPGVGKVCLLFAETETSQKWLHL